MKHELKINRAYETPEQNDGRHILVDRLWPRGLTKKSHKSTCPDQISTLTPALPTGKE